MEAIFTVLASPRVAAMRSAVPDGDWDVDLQHYSGHFLQSSAWLRVQERLGYAVMASRGESWLWGGAIRAGRFPRYVYVPYGPAGTEIGAALGALSESAREHMLDFARIEPLTEPATETLRSVGAVSTKPVQPRWTWVLNLMQEEGELRRGLSAGHRGSINAASRRGLTIRRSGDPDDVEVFCDLQRRASGRRKYRGQTANYYRALADVLLPQQAGSLYFAEAEGRAAAAAISFDFGKTRYYAHAVSDPDAGRRLAAAAPLVWQMILDARADGRSEFDFWGVAPPDTPSHPWAGFTQFKRSFGGHIVEHPGAWEIPIRPLRHRLYSIARSVKR